MILKLRLKLKYQTKLAKLIVILQLLSLSSCSSNPPIQIADEVDIDRFMGKWYVIASVPSFFEKDTYDATEVYQRGEENQVLTTYSFREGSHDASVKSYNPTAFVTEHPSNAIWQMQFIWPFKADYRILKLDHNYSQTIIGRLKRDYFWIMARQPSIPKEDFLKHLEFLKGQGYDINHVRKIPHQELNSHN